MPMKAAVECTADEYTQLMTTNLESCFHLSQLAHPLLLRASIAGGGSIINISFISGSIAYSGVALYAISKGTPDSSWRSNELVPPILTKT
jgi:Tropinone reductase 1